MASNFGKKPNQQDPRELMRKQPNSPTRIVNGLRPVLGTGVNGTTAAPPRAPGLGNSPMQPAAAPPQSAAQGPRQESQLPGGSYGNNGGWRSASNQGNALPQSIRNQQQQMPTGRPQPMPGQASFGGTMKTGARPMSPKPMMAQPNGNVGLGGVAKSNRQQLSGPAGFANAAAAPVLGLMNQLQSPPPSNPNIGTSTSALDRSDEASDLEVGAGERLPTRQEDVDRHKAGNLWVDGVGDVSYAAVAEKAGITVEQLASMVEEGLASGERLNYDEKTGNFYYRSENSTGASGNYQTTDESRTVAPDSLANADNQPAPAKEAEPDYFNNIPQLDEAELKRAEAITRAEHAQANARNIRGLMAMQAYAGGDAEAGMGRVADMSAQQAIGTERDVTNQRLQSMQQNFSAQMAKVQMEHERAVAAGNHAAAAELAKMGARLQAQQIRLQHELNNQITGQDLLGAGLGGGMAALGFALGRG